jgi:hypothetical protein
VVVSQSRVEKRFWKGKAWWRGVLAVAAGLTLVGAWQLFLTLAAALTGDNRWGNRCPGDQVPPVQRVSRPIPDGGIVRLALGGNRSCVVTAGEQAFCWGIADVSDSNLRRRGDRGNDGRLWLRGPRDPYEGLVKFGRDPEPAPSAPQLVEVAQNRFAYCMLDRASALSCSRVSATDLHGPTYQPAATLANIKSIAVGNDHACALTNTQEAWCWGNNARGQANPGSESPVSAPKRVRSNVSRLALGLSHTCLVTADRKPQIECMGDDSLGQLGGFAKTTARSAPPPFDATEVAQLTAGYSRTCALLKTGAVWCWAGYLAVDLPANQPELSPKHVAELPSDVVQIAAGGDVICARSVTGKLHCWGVLQCLDPFACPSPAHPQPSPPTLMKTTAPATDVQVGDQHVCARLETGQVVCMGANQFSQLGANLPLTERQGPAPCLAKEWFEAWSSSEFLPVVW